MNIAAFIITTLCMMYFSNEDLKKSINGKKILDGTELIFMGFIYWRADSSFRSDIKNAKKVFGYSSLISAVLFILLNKLELTGNYYLAFIFLFSFFIWGALEWATNPLKETLKWVTPLLCIAFIPFVLYLLSVGNTEYLYPYIHFSDGFEIISLSVNPSFQLALYITLFIIGVVFIISFIWLFLNSVVISLFFSISWITAQLSKLILKKRSSPSLIIFVILITTSLITTIYNSL